MQVMWTPALGRLEEKMKKIIFHLFLVFIISALFGCSQPSSSTDNSSAEQPDNQTKKMQLVFLSGQYASISYDITDDVFANGNLIQNASMHKGWITGIVTNSHHGVMKLS